jgi:hypothetical protein
MIAVGSCNPDVTATIVQTLMEKSEADLHDTYARFLPLGLGLCHLGELTFTSHALHFSSDVHSAAAQVLFSTNILSLS